ncbi:MAG: TRAP transporter large permease subunit [Lachnospiraceae bacterium]|nr:TRAP transporter large permease subunit [Candidatus Minthocola equi]
MIAAVFIVFFVALLLCVPVGIILLISALTPYITTGSFAVNPEYLFRNFVMAFNNISIVSIPLFIFSGVLMAKGQISKKIYDFFSYFLGKIPGGMPSAVVLTCLFYGAISGSGPATTAAVGSMTIPMLISLGYEPVFAAALVAVAGGLGVIIPPSIPFIMYSDSSGASIGDMFIGGVLPGILIGLLLIAYTVFSCIKKGEDKEKIYALVDELRGKGFWPVLKDSFFALLSPVIILGGIYSGIATPTEAACISVVYAFIVAVFVYKTISIKDMPDVLLESVRTLCPCIVITGAAAIFAKSITLLRVPQAVLELLGGVANNQVALLLIINGVLLICGCLIDTGAAVLIMTPILLPAVTNIGMNPVHFGIMMVVNLAIGFVTPPVGMNLFVASSLTSIPPMNIAKRAVPLLIMFFIALMLITFVPEISLLLV